MKAIKKLKVTKSTKFKLNNKSDIPGVLLVACIIVVVKVKPITPIKSS